MSVSASRILLCLSLVALPLIGGSPGEETGGQGSVVTLWATDELRSAYSFDNGDYAVDIVDGQALLDRAQIAFSLFAPDQLSVGFVTGQEFRLVDLDDLKVAGYPLPKDRAIHPPLSVYHSLFLQGQRLYYRGPPSRTYPLREADPVFFTLETGRVNSFKPELGHSYVLRYASQRARIDEDKLVKFRVVDFAPGRYVTFRWARLK